MENVSQLYVYNKTFIFFLLSKSKTRLQVRLRLCNLLLLSVPLGVTWTIMQCSKQEHHHCEKKYHGLMMSPLLLVNCFAAFVHRSQKVSLVGFLSAHLVPLSHTVSLTLQPLNSYASLFNTAGRNGERGRHLPSFAFPSSSSSKRSVCSSWSDCCLRMSKVLLWASFRAWTSSLCSCFRRSSRAWQRGWRWCNGDTFFPHVALTDNVWAVCELHLWKLFFWVCRGKN